MEEEGDLDAETQREETMGRQGQKLVRGDKKGKESRGLLVTTGSWKRPKAFFLQPLDRVGPY